MHIKGFVLSAEIKGMILSAPLSTQLGSQYYNRLKTDKTKASV